MMSKKDYYEVLEISKTATPEEIKKSYKKLVKVHHPDKGGDEERFKEISEAYDVLSNTDKKSNYDNYGHNEPQQRQRSYQSHFRHSYQQQTKVGESMVLTLKLTLEEIYTGLNKKLKYQRNDKCGDCHGHGGTNPVECYACGGSGLVIQEYRTPMGIAQSISTCGVCSGSGVRYSTPCNTCNSSGVKQVEETIEINLPSGVAEGMTMVERGKGQAIKGGENGDLIIKILEAPHSVYTRNGNDLKMTLKLDYTQLVLGDKVEIDTIDGGKIRITIPEYSDVGSNLKIQTKGLKVFNSENRGDLVVNLGINIPKNIDEDTKELLIKLKGVK